MKKLFGLLAVAGLLVVAAPAKQAEAAMMAPGITTAIQGGSESLAIEVRGRRHGGWHRHRGWHRGYGMRRHYGWRPHRWHRRHWW